MSKKTTKRALAMSFVSVFLCVCMLVGTTFAWFTDSVTSSNNVIKSGTLDVTMGWAEGKLDPATATYTDASQGAIFNSQLWEPGYVEARHIKIENKGTLALKYQLNIIANGEVTDLAKVIDVYFIDGGKQIPTRAALETVTPVGTLDKVLDGTLANLDMDGDLKATESDTVTIALKMQETADNKYQNKSIGSAFAVQLLATQLTYESDSFDDLYDQNAGYAVEVNSADALADALRGGGLVKLTGDIAVSESMTIPAGVTVNLDLNGQSITAAKAKNSGALLVNNGTLNIVDGTMKNTETNGDAVINNKGTLTLDDVTINGAPIDATGYPAYAVITSGKLTVEDGTTIDTNRGAISMSDGAEVVINGGTFKVSDAADGRNMTLHTIYAYGNSKLTINGGYFEQDHTSTGGASVICPAGATIDVYGGDFRDAMDDDNWTSTGNFQNYMGYTAPVKVYGGTYDDETFNKWLATGYEATDNGDGTYTVQLSTATGAEIKDQLNDSTTTNVVLGQDVDLDDPAFQSNGNMSLTVKDGKTLDLNNNSVIRPASGSGSGVVIPGGATTTVKNGSIISEGDMTSIDIASGATATFEKMEFVGNGSGFARVRANSNAKTTLIFRECSFTNATVEIVGMNGACDVDIQFIDCTFEGSYKMYDENGNLLTDPHGNVHYTNELFSAESSYIFGSFTFDGCTFDYDASESSYARSVIALFGPSASYGKTLTVTLKDVTVTGEKIIPVTVDSRYKASVTIVEEGTNTYTNNGVAVNYDGSAK